MAINIIKPDEAYNKDNFVAAMDHLTGIERILEDSKTPEKAWDVDNRSVLGDWYKDDSSFYAGMSPDHVIKDANAAIGLPQTEMIKYSKKNWKTFLEKINDKVLLSLITTIPLKETGNKEQDEVVKAINEVKLVSQAQETGNVETYINSKIAKADKWRQEAYLSYSSGDPSYVQRTFNAYAHAAQAALNKAIRTEKGNIRKSLLRGLLKGNVEKAKGKTADVLKLTIAKAAYESIR